MAEILAESGCRHSGQRGGIGKRGGAEGNSRHFNIQAVFCRINHLFLHNSEKWVKEGLKDARKVTITGGQSLIAGISAPVAQLDRALPSEGKGRTFESSRVRHIFQYITVRSMVNI